MQIHRSFNRSPSGIVRRARCARSTARPAGRLRASVRPSGVSVVGDLSRRFQAQGAIRGDGGRFDGRSVGERRANGRARERKRRVFSRVRCSEKERERKRAAKSAWLLVRRRRRTSNRLDERPPHSEEENERTLTYCP